MKKKKIFLLGSLFLFSACSSLSKKEDPAVYKALAGYKNSVIAVLPFDNASTDMEAGKVLGDLVFNKFVEKGWMPLQKEALQEKLTELGVSDGGQLPAFKPVEVAAKTGARLLCYGYIENFKFQNLGFIVRKNVELNLKIVDGMTGEVLFERKGKGSDIKIYTDKDEAKAAFLINTGVKLVGNITNKPLMAESRKAVEYIFREIP